MDLVINEWFPEYCRVETPDGNKELLVSFLEKFLKKKDVLYIKRPSPFLDKIFTYGKEYQTHRDVYTIRVITDFIKQVILNSEKCVFVDDDCELENAVLDKLNEANTNFASDTYLFEAASGTANKLIITTDDKLCRQMHAVAGYQVINLKDFLKDY